MSLVQRSEVSIRVTKKIVSGAEKRSFHSSDQEELEEMNVEQHHRGPARHCTAERAVMLAPALTVSTRFCFWTISAVAS